MRRSSLKKVQQTTEPFFYLFSRKSVSMFYKFLFNQGMPELTGIFFSANKFLSTHFLLSRIFIDFLTIKKSVMSVIKVIEIMSNSTKSWEDAAQRAVEEASKTLHNIRSIYIKDHNAVVENGKIKEYRVTGKVSFELDQME
jgi:dodecin